MSGLRLSSSYRQADISLRQRQLYLVVTIALVAAVQCLVSQAAELPANAWRQTASLAAPEATQAAAADENFVYAVANRVVAKYDRRSGERIAVSTGEAHHLNSAFLWQGKIYCAHSNYPQAPEQSQVMQLDPQSMRLEPFHNFGEFVGSLTWVIRRDGDWWCNFARYGADNAQTTLVRFDANWKETGRWRYPAEVIRKLGERSLSGGVWRDDLLVVTDHDHRVVYRLRLPETGEFLSFVDRQESPFPGQGIANDPLTGGLVGIDRARRSIVFARLNEPLLERPSGQPQRLRVLSYNIHHAEGTDGKLDLPRIAQAILEVAPDVVALQEVDQQARRTQQVDQPAEFARLCQMHVAFGPNIPLQGGHYGNALLSRLPIAGHQNHRLPNLDNGEQRGVLDARLKLPGGDESLRLLITHLDARPADQERKKSAEVINGLADEDRMTPMLLLGDLNAVPESDVLKILSRVWANSNREPALTSPSRAPRNQIDYVLSTPAARWRVVETCVLDEAVASDHRPLLVVLDLLPRVAP